MPARLTAVKSEAMTVGHHIALAKTNAYFGAPPSGPFAVWAHHPAFMEGAFQLFLAHRHEDKLDRSLFELAIIVVARNWSADFVWARHSQAALKTGIDGAIVEAIRTARPPAFTSEPERAAATIIHELTWERKVSSTSFVDAQRLLGPERLVALINAASFYAMVCNSTVAFETPLPDRLGVLEPLPALRDLTERTHGAVSGGSDGRLADLDDALLTPAQRIEVGKMRAHFGFGPRGPFQAWAHQAGVAAGAFQLFQAMSFEGLLDAALKEILAVTVARQWGCEFLWRSHAVHAAKAGVAPAIIEAIRTGARPGFTDEAQQTLHQVATELAGLRRLSDATYRRAVDAFGETGLVLIVDGISFFTMVCMTIVAFDPPVPERPNAPAPLPALDGAD